MKELAPLLWIFVIVGAWIFSAVKKANKETNENPSKHMPEAWPEAPAMPQQQEEEQMPASEQKAQNKHTKGEQKPENTAQILSYELNEYKKHMQTRNKPRQTVKPAPEALPETHKSGDESQSASTIGEEFDLRKAIIYSEILKPKFDE